MILLSEKIKKYIDRHGTKVNINSSECRILIRLMSSGEAKTYLDDIEYMGIIKPAYFIVFSYDTPIEENSSFVLEGRNFSVKKVTPVFYGNEIIFRSAVIF